MLGTPLLCKSALLLFCRVTHARTAAELLQLQHMLPFSLRRRESEDLKEEIIFIISRRVPA